jgi:hypothetical protein
MTTWRQRSRAINIENLGNKLLDRALTVLGELAADLHLEG